MNRNKQEKNHPKMNKLCWNKIIKRSVCRKHCKVPLQEKECAKEFETKMLNNAIIGKTIKNGSKWKLF